MRSQARKRETRGNGCRTKEGGRSCGSCGGGGGEGGTQTLLPPPPSLLPSSSLLEPRLSILLGVRRTPQRPKGERWSHSHRFHHFQVPPTISLALSPLRFPLCSPICTLCSPARARFPFPFPFRRLLAVALVLIERLADGPSGVEKARERPRAGRRHSLSSSDPDVPPFAPPAVPPLPPDPPPLGLPPSTASPHTLLFFARPPVTPICPPLTLHAASLPVSFLFPSAFNPGALFGEPF